MKDLTIRDKIAIEAMNGILSSGDIDLVPIVNNDDPRYSEALSKVSYAIADAMLKEREKKEGE